MHSTPIKWASLPVEIYVGNGGRVRGIRMGMLAPRKFMQKRKKVEVFKDAADEAYQKNWRRLMNEIDEAGTAVEVLRRERIKNQALPRELVLGTLKRFKQMKRWNLVSEVWYWFFRLDCSTIISVDEFDWRDAELQLEDLVLSSCLLLKYSFFF